MCASKEKKSNKMNFNKFPKFTILRLFLFIIVCPTVMVLVIITATHSDPREYKVTHEVYFDIESDGQSMGRMVIGLFGETVPRTVKNFITFATKGYNGYKYEGTKFHRVIKKFMIQGGDVVSGDGQGSISIYGPAFPDENFEIKHSTPGFISMANKGKDTNGCQFFIITVSTPWLDDHHVVFGKVIKGDSIAHTIEHMSTDWDDKPLKDVTIVKSGRLAVKTPYYITDDPYNVYDWLKTISIPIGLSFGIIYLFSRFIDKLDDHIIDDDGAGDLDEDDDDKIAKPKEEKKPLLAGEEKKEEKQGSEKEGKKKEEKQGGEKEGKKKEKQGGEKEEAKEDMEVRKRIGKSNAKKDE